MINSKTRIQKTGGNHKSVREYEVARKQAERLDSEYAVAWFNYQAGAIARLEAAVNRGESLQDSMRNSLGGTKGLTLPNNSQKRSWNEGRVEREGEAKSQQEKAAQDANNSAEADVGEGTAAGLSSQAGEMLENTQNKGVLGMPLGQSQSTGTAQSSDAKAQEGSTQKEAEPQQSGEVKPLDSPLGQSHPNAARVSYEGEAAEAGTALAKRKKPVSMPEVMAALAKAIEAIGGKAKGMFRKGFVGRRAGGHYELVSQVTRLRSIGDISVAAHELGHALDALLFKPYTHWEDNRLGLSDEARGELRKLGQQLYGKKEPHNGYISEGFAEFVRLWFTDSEQAKKKAPEFSAWMEGKLGQEPELAKAMAYAQALAHRYLRQGAEARGDSGIVETPTVLENGIEISREQMRNFRKYWFERAAALEEMVAEAARRRGEKALPAALDAMLTLTGRRMTADAVVRSMATKGMQDFAGNPTGGAPLTDAFALVKGKTRKFVIYLWAKRTIALWDDPRGPRASGLAIEDARYLVEHVRSDTPQCQ